MTFCNAVFRPLTAVAAALLLVAGAATAQNFQYAAAHAPAGSGLHATRAELEQLLSAYQARGDAQSGEAAAIRTRLEEGDFRTGDQVTVVVETHPDLSATYTVEPNRTIAVPGVGSVPLRGVLRSELQPHLTEYLAQYVRSPRVRAQSTIRIMVLGGVGRPGFYSVPAHALITEVIDSAGGTSRDSRLTSIRIERNGERLMEGQPLQEAIIAGRTLDQLSVRAGDRIVVPQRRTNNIREVMGWTGTLLGLTWAVLRLTGR
jgi:polysaccharide biosynthesis/export protein